MTAFNHARLNELFRERAQLSQAHKSAQQEAGSLTLEHNRLIRQGEQAVTQGGRQQARLRADRKGQEAKNAHARAQQISEDLHHTEVEIADMIAALVAAAQPFLTAQAIEQLTENLVTINQRLQHIDQGIISVSPAIEELRTALRDHADTERSTAANAATALAQVLRELEHHSRSLQTISSTLAGQRNQPEFPRASRVVQMGWEQGGTDLPDSRSPELTDREVSALPEKVTVLLFASEPRDQPRLDLDMEIREIYRKLDEARFRDRITLVPWLAAEPLDLVPNVNRHKPHMVQFSGHGTPDGFLLMGPPNRSEPLSADRLIQMLKWTGQDLRIVFFNICDSEEHARAAAQIVDAAIGMRGKMHDNPARIFAASLYSGLAFGNSLKHAFYQACAAIGGQPDSTIPQLFFSADTDPHTVVLVRPDADAS